MSWKLLNTWKMEILIGPATQWAYPGEPRLINRPLTAHFGELANSSEL